MTTQTISGLEALLSGLKLKIPIPPFPASDVLNKPLDIGRSYLADILTSIVECDLVTACKSIQLPNNIYSGDFTVILPKLSHGGDFNALAIKIIQKVCYFFFDYTFKIPADRSR
jgi:arginyl-tRNA synthetase